jgi:hypothetical protein
LNLFLLKREHYKIDRGNLEKFIFTINTIKMALEKKVLLSFWNTLNIGDEIPIDNKNTEHLRCICRLIYHTIKLVDYDKYTKVIDYLYKFNEQSDFIVNITDYIFRHHGKPMNIETIWQKEVLSMSIVDHIKGFDIWGEPYILRYKEYFDNLIDYTLPYYWADINIVERIFGEGYIYLSQSTIDRFLRLMMKNKITFKDLIQLYLTKNGKSWRCDILYILDATYTEIRKNCGCKLETLNMLKYNDLPHNYFLPLDKIIEYVSDYYKRRNVPRFKLIQWRLCARCERGLGR